MTDAVAYKVLYAEQWERLRTTGLFSGSADDIRDGYIHLSALGQLRGTLDKYFEGKHGLQLAEIDLSQLGETVRWEKSRGGADFPHIYGGLPLSAVKRHWTLGLDRHDKPVLPREL